MEAEERERKKQKLNKHSSGSEDRKDTARCQGVNMRRRNMKTVRLKRNCLLQQLKKTFVQLGENKMFVLKLCTAHRVSLTLSTSNS